MFPGGQFIEKEGQQDLVQNVAVRMNKIPEVAAQFKNFLAALPAAEKEKLRKGEEPSIWMLRDSDENADLVQFSRNYSKVLNKTGRLEAAQAAEKLGGALTYPAEDPSLTPILISDKKASGAWVNVTIDPYVKNRDVAICMAIKAFYGMNWDQPEFISSQFIKKDKVLKLDRENCNYLADEKEEATKDKSSTKKSKKINNQKQLAIPSGKPEAINEFLNIKVKWPHGIPAYITESPNREKKAATQRILSIWVPLNEKNQHQAKLIFTLPGTESIHVEYIAKDPLIYINQKPGFESLRVGQSTTAVAPAVYVSGTKNGLYVAEAHSSRQPFQTRYRNILRRQN